MDRDFHTFQARIEAILPTLATKADIETVRTDMLRLSNETHKWMLASVIGMFIGFGGLFMAVSNTQHQALPAPVLPAANPAPAGTAPPVANAPLAAPAAGQAAAPEPARQIAFIIINPAAEPPPAQLRK